LQLCKIALGAPSHHPASPSTMHPLSFALIFSVIAFSNAQVPHNVTSIEGTWSSGSGAVTTGPDFVNPLNFTFHYPKNTGISYSFTDTGFFEQAEYRMVSNGSQPNCIKGTVVWQHGTWDYLSNGSIVGYPFAPDGRLQVQDPCAAQSNVIMQFNTTLLFSSWRIFSDPLLGPKLQLYAYDGSPMSPMYLKAIPPNMLPTQTLSANGTINGDGALSAAHANVARIGLMVLVAVSGVAVGTAILL